MLKDKAAIFKALGEPNRLKILKLLSGKSLCVTEITADLDLAASTVSKHLSILKEAGFLTEEKKSKWIYYKINTHSKEPTVTSILGLLNFWLDEKY